MTILLLFQKQNRVNLYFQYIYINLLKNFFSSKFNKNSFGTISLNVYKIDE